MNKHISSKSSEIALAIAITANPAVQADPIFGRIEKHRAIVSKIADNDAHRVVLSDAKLIRLMQSFDVQAWALLDNPPVTRAGAEALLGYSVEVENILGPDGLTWPDGAAASARPGKNWSDALRKVVVDVMTAPSKRDDSDAKILELEAQIDRVYDQIHEIARTRIEPHQEAFEALVASGGLRDKEKQRQFEEATGRDAAISEQDKFAKEAVQLSDRMWAIPAHSNIGRAAKVRVFMKHVADDVFFGADEELNWDISYCRRLLLEFAGMTPAELPAAV